MTWLGELALWVALLMAAWGACAGTAGALQRRGDLAASGARAVVAAAASLTVAVAGLWDALLGADLSVRYVARWVGANVPTAWRFAAAWAGPEGRLLLWAWLVAIIGAVAILIEWRRRSVTSAWSIAATSFAIAAAIVLSAFGANPFVRLAFEPPDGGGLPPAFHETVFLWQPPLLLVGLALAAPVTVVAMGSRLTGGADQAAIVRLRRWAGAAWTFVSIGLVLGAWWTWAARGEEDRWVVDALASPSMVAWLALAAVLHLLVGAERDAARRPRAVAFAALAWIATFPAVLLSSVVPWEGARSLASRGFAMGTWVVVIGLAALVGPVWRRPVAGTSSMATTAARSVGGRVSALGGAATLLLAIAGVLAVTLARVVASGASAAGNGMGRVLMAALAAAIVLAAASTVLPWRGHARGAWRRLALAAAFALAAALVVARTGSTVWLTLALAGAVFALVACALAALRAGRARANAPAHELPVADVRRAAGLVAHIGAALLLAGLAGASARARHEITLGAGDAASLRDPVGLHWDLVGQGISRYDAESREVLAVAIELRQGTAAPRLVTSELRRYYDARGIPLGDVVAVSGRHATPLGEVRVSLLEAPADERARLRITFAPLLWLAWFGGALLAVGGGLALLPASRAVVRNVTPELGEPPARTTEATES